MADIFGRNQEDYAYIRYLQEKNLLERYEQDLRTLYPASEPLSFNTLEAGIPKKYQRATEDAQALGYITDNLLSIQTQADDILYTAYRLPMWVHINTAIAEGSRSYGLRVRNRQGQAERLTAPGYEAPSATVSESLVNQPIHNYGLDAEWSLSELRGAMIAGTPLDTESVDAAVTGTMEKMEAVALWGGGYAEKGLFNLDSASAGATPTGTQVHLQNASSAFADMTGEQMRALLNSELTKIIENSRETFGRNVNTGATIYLPGTQYDLLATKYIGDNADRTVMQSIMQDNPWTHFTNGNPLAIERVLELSQEHVVGASNSRMVVALKHERVAEIGVPIMPRVIRIMDKGRVICAQVEAEFSPLFVKRPNTIYYTDGI